MYVCKQLSLPFPVVNIFFCIYRYDGTEPFGYFGAVFGGGDQSGGAQESGLRSTTAIHAEASK